MISGSPFTTACSQFVAKKGKLLAHSGKLDGFIWRESPLTSTLRHKDLLHASFHWSNKAVSNQTLAYLA